MPTSLVSTGVQFPDSTIQTTAASGGAGATSKGSVLFWGYRLIADANNRHFLNVNASDNVFTKPFQASTQMLFFNSSTDRGLTNVFFSAYYSCYFGILQDVTGSQSTTPVTSKDGLTWMPNIAWFGNGPFGSTQVLMVGVNESNGDIHVITSSNTIWYSTNGGATWTQNTNGFSGGPTPGTGSTGFVFRYLNSGTASTSRLVFLYTATSGNVQLSSLAGNAAPSSAWSHQSAIGAAVSQYQPTAGTYGSLMTYLMCDGGTTRGLIYDATTNVRTVYNDVDASLALMNWSTTGGSAYFIALNNSFWIAPCSSAGLIRWGTVVAGPGLSPSGTVALSGVGAINTCCYDGTRWLAFTNAGLWATTQANPSTGWAKVGNPSLGISSVNQFSNNTGLTLYGRPTLFQRDVLY